MTPKVMRHSVPSREAAEQAVADAVSTEPHVVAAHLFGSVVRGTAGPLSDVDVGLLLGRDADVDEVCGRVADALSRRLHSSKMDVVSLADASPVVRYRVIRDGVRVVCRDRAAWEAFAVGAVLQYLDFAPLRNQAFRVVRAMILGTADGR